MKEEMITHDIPAANFMCASPAVLSSTQTSCSLEAQLFVQFVSLPLFWASLPSRLAVSEHSFERLSSPMLFLRHLAITDRTRMKSVTAVFDQL